MTGKPFEERLIETIQISEEADDVEKMENVSRWSLGITSFNIHTTDGRIISASVQDITDIVE